MLDFANAKINVGLHVTNKRSEGYHDLETVFYPVKLYDAIEILPSQDTLVHIEGYQFPLNEDNLCFRAYRLLRQEFDLSPVSIHLLKKIPVGAGLGGGSSDASYVLKMLNSFFELKLSYDELEKYAAKLGADCPFFIQNKPVFASGIGTTFEHVDLNLDAYHIVVVKPNMSISTSEAYRSITPKLPNVDLKQAIKLPVQEWKFHIFNDFEYGIEERYPEIAAIKEKLYEQGALYTSMSGSGSAVYGIFEALPKLEKLDMLGEIYYPVDLK